MTDFSHFKEQTSNAEWAKEMRARVADLNEQLREAEGRNIIVALDARQSYGIPNSNVGIPEINITIAERI